MSKILVVEDEVHIQRLIKLVLEKNGLQVDCVSNGEDALKYIGETEPPDLVLLDILMPGVDGMQVLRSIKSHAKTKSIPVIMLTALAQSSVVMQGIKLGANDYIRKPFHPGELVKRVTKQLAS